MPLSKVTTHTTDALNRLPEQHKGKVRLEALLTALVNESQNVENALFDIFILRRLDVATAAQLDDIGVIVGLDRGGRIDDDYRQILRAKIRANRSKARNEDLIEVARLLLGEDTTTITTKQFNNATAFINVNGKHISQRLSNDLIEFLDSTSGAGIKTLLQFSITTPPEEFSFAMAAHASVAIGIADTTIETSGIPSGIPATGGTLLLGENTPNEETAAYTAHDGTDFTGVSGVANTHAIGTALSFDDSLGKGFGNEADLGVGGQFAEVLCEPFTDTVMICSPPGVMTLVSITPDVKPGFTFDALTASATGGNNTVYSSASYTPDADKLIIADVFGLASGGVPETPISMVGNGLTWVLVATADVDPAFGGRLCRFRAMGAAPTTGTLTATYSGTRTAHAFMIYQIDGVDTSGVNGENAIGASDTDEVNPGTAISMSLAGPIDGSFAATASAGGTITGDAQFTQIAATSVNPQDTLAEIDADGSETTYDSTLV